MLTLCNTLHRLWTTGDGSANLILGRESVGMLNEAHMKDVKKHPTVSFRAGPMLAEELLKRGDEAEMSLIAKGIVTDWFETMKAEKAGLRMKFRPADPKTPKPQNPKTPKYL